MSDLIKLGLKEAAEKIKNKEITSVELVTALLNRMEARNNVINGYVHIDRDHALAMAADSDERVKNGNPRLLEGVPVAIKDLFCTKGVRTTACSKMLENFVPAYESTVTEHLWQAGAVLLGKTNMDEFAMGASGENSAFGAAANPWDTSRVAGGSSSGSAAVVSDWQAPAATGSDTGGSIRYPAAFTGLVGLRPTYGRCSRYGMVAFASSLDQAAPIARNVEDTALLFRAMSGYDEKDTTSADKPIEAYDEDLANFDVKGLKIGLPKEYFIEGLDPEIRELTMQTAKRFEERGAELVDISLPHTQYAVPTYYIIAPAEAAANLSRYDGMRYGLRVPGDNLKETYVNSRSAGFGEEVQRRIMVGNYTLSSGYYDAYYTKAQKVRSLITKDLHEAFKQVDVILTPTAPSAAFKMGEKTADPIQMYMCDVFLNAAALAGTPGISVPAGTVEQDGTALPVGVQFMAPAFEERKLLQIAYAHEQMIDFKLLEAQG